MVEQISKQETVELRKKFIPSCVELFFREDPLKIVRAQAQYMYDEKGNKYLDCINNVAHVGHCHPYVVKKTCEQMGLLETNSRFLHETLVIYAKRILSYMPSTSRLDQCFFTNSGSECNDLALRLARKFTGAQDVLVLDHAYHGHLTSMVDLSPYKFNHAGGDGKPEWVHVVPVPDVYRGKYRDMDYGYDDEKLSELYAQEVIDEVERVEKSGRRIALFYAESLQSCGGQVVYPKGWLRRVYRFLQARGILCLADEVQCGFYRSGGSTMWSFQVYGAELAPDFVTLGKSMGNGHPVACLVTRSDIATKFGERGMQYFNTYGGNPVSMAAANAVLDVIEQERLYEHVEEVSRYLMHELELLKKKHAAIVGDVRGHGYFIGIDFVKDPKTREPDTKLAYKVLRKMKENHHILLSLDGPYNNVMKIKPPLPFNKQDAQHLIAKLDHVLQHELND